MSRAKSTRSQSKGCAELQFGHSTRARPSRLGRRGEWGGPPPRGDRPVGPHAATARSARSRGMSRCCIVCGAITPPIAIAIRTPYFTAESVVATDCTRNGDDGQESRDRPGLRHERGSGDNAASGQARRPDAISFAAPVPGAVHRGAGPLSLREAACGAGTAGTQWTCPMHPEIVRDGPGACPICGMALEPLTPSPARKQKTRAARHDAAVLGRARR